MLTGGVKINYPRVSLLQETGEAQVISIPYTHEQLVLAEAIISQLLSDSIYLSFFPLAGEIAPLC